MALTYGFFNAIKSDRRYNSEQMSEIFDGIITDGILANVGQHFAVTTASNGLQINVGTGRAWFNHTWTKNDSVMVLTVDQPDISRDRIDAVVLEVNHDDAVRANSIYIVKGTASVNPQKPELPNSDKVKLYPLAYITVKVDATEIKAEDIENAIGLTPCPFATGILQTTPIDELWEQWRGEWNTWFANIKLQLTEDVVTNLQYQIDSLKTGVVKTADKATTSEAKAGINDTKWMTPLTTKQAITENSKYMSFNGGNYTANINGNIIYNKHLFTRPHTESDISNNPNTVPMYTLILNDNTVIWLGLNQSNTSGTAIAYNSERGITYAQASNWSEVFVDPYDNSHYYTTQITATTMNIYEHKNPTFDNPIGTRTLLSTIGSINTYVYTQGGSCIFGQGHIIRTLQTTSATQYSYALAVISKSNGALTIYTDTTVFSKTTAGSIIVVELGGTIDSNIVHLYCCAKLSTNNQPGLFYARFDLSNNTFSSWTLCNNLTISSGNSIYSSSISIKQSQSNTYISIYVTNNNNYQIRKNFWDNGNGVTEISNSNINNNLLFTTISFIMEDGGVCGMVSNYLYVINKTSIKTIFIPNTSSQTWQFLGYVGNHQYALTHPYGPIYIYNDNGNIIKTLVCNLMSVGYDPYVLIVYYRGCFLNGTLLYGVMAQDTTPVQYPRQLYIAGFDVNTYPIMAKED